MIPLARTLVRVALPELLDWIKHDAGNVGKSEEGQQGIKRCEAMKSTGTEARVLSRLWMRGKLQKQAEKLCKP